MHLKCLYRMIYFVVFNVLLLNVVMAGNSKNKNLPNNNEQNMKLFSLLSPEMTHLQFANLLPEINELNILTYQYFYNGGGVAIGDINNDNLPDIYFSGNLVPNRLYLNKGNFRFEDVTETAGVKGPLGWTTGVTMADVNHDGLLDIYVCRSGKVPERQRMNLLYINNGDLTFSEKAANFGLADPGYSTQAIFFDYDRDGDLDMYLLNHAIEIYTNVDVKSVKSRYDPFVGDKLFRNDGHHFTDVSGDAGIYTHPLGFGLGVSVGDLNNDGWPDIYVANDFIEHDYLYMNNGDGTFSDRLTEEINHTSLYSMGTDIADFNNDGWLDIISLDMAAEDNYRQKTNMSGMNTEKFYQAVKNGFHYQYMYNALQLNNGNDTFSEIGQLAGISKTDWSWSPLFADFDNDGYKDLFVTNGYRRDASNNDFITALKKRFTELSRKLQYGSLSEITKIKDKGPLVSIVKEIPSVKIKNYAFQNNGDLTFSKKSEKWGLDQPGFSNGAAYADLDNDGDLDLIVNNIDAPAFVYRNNSREMNHNHYLKVKLRGPQLNPFGVGARVTIKSGSQLQTLECYLTRGYQSAVDGMLHFGLGLKDRIDSLTIRWPDGKKQILTDLSADQTLTLDDENAITTRRESPAKQPKLFEDITSASGVAYRHQENEYNDFEKETLLPHKTSRFGPGISVGDANGDGLEDFFVGAAKGFSGSLYLQTTHQTFRTTASQPWKMDRESEDIGAVFFDADNDGDSDLYIVSGGNEFVPDSPELQDRLYLNDGQANFTKSLNALPVMLTSGSCVVPGDFDKDGDTDLFVGGRLIPGKYPFPPRSYLLQNDGGKFADVTQKLAPDLLKPGLVTAAVWTDFNSDGQLDLIVVGEWMDVLLMRNEGGQFINNTSLAGLNQTTGWWFSITAEDVDRDGDMDVVAGNLGLNYKYKASVEEPFSVYCRDFDQNGTLDIVLGYYNGSEIYPLRGRQCSSEQMPFIKEKFPTYEKFALASLTDVYGMENLNTSLHYDALTFATTYFENLGNGKFKSIPLPNLAQLSSVNGILIDDFDNDGHSDLVIAGNLYESEVETPRNDAGMGLFLKGDDDGRFKAVGVYQGGFFAKGDVKAIRLIRLGKKEKRAVLVAKNDDYLQLIRVIE